MTEFQREYPNQIPPGKTGAWGQFSFALKKLSSYVLPARCTTLGAFRKRASQNRRIRHNEKYIDDALGEMIRKPGISREAAREFATAVLWISNLRPSTMHHVTYQLDRKNFRRQTRGDQKDILDFVEHVHQERLRNSTEYAALTVAQQGEHLARSLVVPVGIGKELRKRMLAPELLASMLIVCSCKQAKRNKPLKIEMPTRQELVAA